MTDLIVSRNQLEANVECFQDGISSGSTSACDLLRRGRCFVPYFYDDRLHFAPSRFLGYANNSVENHTQHPGKDGRKTNNAINKVVGRPPIEDEALKVEYKRQCHDLDVEPDGVPKKFWITAQASEFVEHQIVNRIQAQHSNVNGSTEARAIVSARLGQGKFRLDLLSYWEGRCPLTGISIEPILKASHIRPWRNSDDSERLDVFNGLLLSANFDELFDKGFIGFDESGTLLVSDRLSMEDRQELCIKDDMKISIEERHKPYLAHHRDVIFR